MNKFSRTTRSVTFAAMCGLALTTGAVGVQATTGFVPAAVAQSVSSPLVDKNAQGTLTLHKKADPSATGTPTGNEDSSVKGTALDGVGFTVYKIKGIDLSTNEGLVAAAALKASDFVKNGVADLEKVEKIGDEQITKDGGKAEWSRLAPSAYLVIETSPKVGYTPAVPFVAFVPMTQDNAEKGGTEWNYNVHAYPKNYAQKTPEKQVKDSGMNVGDKLEYTVTGYAQPIKDGQVRTVFRIEDNLDAKLIAPKPEDVTVDGFTATADYEVSVDGQKVKINFTAEGLKKLGDNQAVVAHIPATVKEQPADGVIENKAQVIENDPNTGNEQTPKDTPTVKTYYGGIKFNKVGAKDGKALAGAEFKVFGVKDGQTCSKDSVDNKALDPIKINGEPKTYTSADETGLVTIDGLHVNDYANDTQGVANLYQSYCLVETKSPKGFELLAQPVEFKVLKSDVETGQAERIIKLVNEEGKIKNLEDTTPNLPMTGGAGIGILAALGALIIGAGAWLARRNSAKS